MCGQQNSTRADSMNVQASLVLYCWQAFQYSLSATYCLGKRKSSEQGTSTRGTQQTGDQAVSKLQQKYSNYERANLSEQELIYIDECQALG